VNGEGNILQKGDANTVCLLFITFFSTSTIDDNITIPILNIIPFSKLFCAIDNNVIKKTTNSGAVKDIYSNIFVKLIVIASGPVDIIYLNINIY
jgi:hypothetical protein